MPQNLTLSDVLETYQKKIYTQDYSKQKLIEGVKIIDLKDCLGEDGDFCEVVKLKENGELKDFPNFKLAQVNRTKVYPNVIKAWHLHLRQNEIWYSSPETHILVGLLDLRRKSETSGLSNRIVLGGRSQLVYIPKGVAHGIATLGGKSAKMIYFVDQEFDPKNPDEQRLNWDILGNDFWQALENKTHNAP